MQALAQAYLFLTRITEERDRLLEEALELRAAESQNEQHRREAVCELEKARDCSAKAIQTVSNLEDACR